jgi:alkylation response protein AidB-like acyl-CoA dehydrogenase
MNDLAAVMPPISERERDVVNAARAFARDVIEPHAGAWEESGGMPRDAFCEAAARGLCRLTVPESMHGQGLGMPAVALIVEAWAAACMASAFALTVHNNLARGITRYGSAAQLERWLPGLSAGEQIGAFLLTEPQGGSDAAAITTTARRDGRGWRLDGAKAWVSNAATADLLSVYAQTDASAGWRGIACFIVKADAPGVIREPAYGLLGGHALGTGGFRFEGCRVGVGDVLVGPGEGFKAALAGVDFARITVAAMCCGMLGRSLDVAMERGAGRHTFGKSVLEHQAVQSLLADAATDLEAARLLTAHAATVLDDGTDRHTLAAAHAKKFATRAALSRIADCMQVMGANGLRTEYPLARHFTAAKMAQYLDGTTEIHNVVIGRAITRPYLSAAKQAGR